MIVDRPHEGHRRWIATMDVAKSLRAADSTMRLARQLILSHMVVS